MNEYINTTKDTQVFAISTFFFFALLFPFDGIQRKATCLQSHCVFKLMAQACSLLVQVAGLLNHPARTDISPAKFTVKATDLIKNKKINKKNIPKSN